MRRLLPILVSLFCVAISAQTTQRSKVEDAGDTAAVRVLKYASFASTGKFSDDTLKLTMRQFRFLDPAMQSARLNASLGNLGTAAYPIRPQFLEGLGPRLGWTAFLPNQYLPEEVPYFKTSRPFSQMTYQLGSASEHYFQALHTQSLLPGWQAGLRFRHQNSVGLYQRQDAVHSNAQVLTRYLSKAKTYAITAHFTHNTHGVQENGGLRNDSSLILGGLFGANGSFLPNTNRSTYPVRFAAAQRQGFRNTAGLRQVWAPWGLPQLNDSGVTGGRFTLVHALVYDNFEDRFSDEAPDTSYYPALLVDSLQSRHSLGYETLRNEVGIKMYLNKKSLSGSPLSLQLGHIAYGLYSTLDTLQQADTTLQEIQRVQVSGQHFDLSGSLSFDLGKSLRADAGGSFVLSGFNQGDLAGFFETEWHWKDSLGRERGLDVKFRADVRLSEPDFLSQNFLSNAKVWQQDFGKTLRWTLDGTANAKRWDAGLRVQAHLLTNYVWWNAQAIPEQNSGSATLLSAEVSKYQRIGPIDLGLFVLGQFSSTNQMPLPNLVAHADLSYTNRFFKKNLELRLGLDVFYISGFSGMGYDVFTGRYFAQQQLSTGNYPFVDFYVAAHIRTAYFFFRLRHVNQGLTGNSYFIAPHHPMQDRTIQVGVVWNFFN